MNLSPLPIQKFFDNNGNPLNGGLLFTYVAGTTTKIATYTDSTGATPNTNPIVLDYRGEANVWLDPSLTYKFTLAPAGDTDPPTKPIWTVDQIASGITASYLTQVIIGQLLYPRTAAEIAAGVTPVFYYYPPGDVRRYGAVGDATTDDASAIANAVLSWNGRGQVFFPTGTFKVNSAITVSTNGITFVGQGCSQISSTGSANRGATCILRGFGLATPTVLFLGDDCGTTGIDYDNNAQGTGECLQFTGGRFVIGTISTRNSGGDGLRGGKTNAGASDTNTNCWYANFVMTCGNVGAGFRLDDTNTTTSASYPLGISNLNSGWCGLVDSRGNGSDGLQLGNCNDNDFGTVHCEGNTGCGVRFKTDGVNWGPRCNTILVNDCEGNVGNDIQIDAGTIPVAAPGGYNKIFGNRSVAVTSRIVDNSTGSQVMQWLPGLPFRAYHWGSDVNALATTGQVGFNAYVGSNNATVRMYGVASGTVDSIMRLATRKNGAGLTDAAECNQYAVFKPLTNHIPITYSASITIDAPTGNIFQINANNAVAFTINAPTNPQTGTEIGIQIRNTSGGVLGAATWNAVFKMSAWTQPANGFSRYVQFFYNGANWIQQYQGGVDVPN